MQLKKKGIIMLSGKRILFFAPAFFGYEHIIKQKMIDMGAKVDFYDERSISSSYEKAILKVMPSLLYRKTKKYYKKILQKNAKKKYDYIFFIKCEMTPKSILQELRNKYPNAKMCLYLYDSIRNVKGIESKFQYFDKVLSFDRKDCENNPNMIFRPLFYSDQYVAKDNNEKYIYDICFIGTIHSDRYKIIKEVQKFCKENNIKAYWFLFLQSKFMYYFYKLTKKEFRGANIETFSFDKMSGQDISEVVSQTNIILDVESPKQTGLTMRTIEMLGMKKKLLTTNRDIVNYDFYDKNNICCVDRNNVKLRKKFFDSKYMEVDKEIYDRYYLENWIKDILL